MKKIPVALAILCAILLQGCFKDTLTRTYTILRPVYKSKAEVYANIKNNTPQQIQTPGKLFVHGTYVFLNEVNKGVHIIDNSDPHHPIDKAFINIPGNLDIAVKGTVLYADMYGDLLTIDIADPMHVKLLDHLSNVFPDRIYEGGFVADTTQIIVDWIKKDTTVAAGPAGNNNIYVPSPLTLQNSDGAVDKVIGISGSMARFVIVNDYMYAVNSHTLQCLSLADPAQPTVASLLDAGWDIETIYPFQNKLFLGSMGGMFIFDISQPADPVADGNFVHARACDPVIADDSYAYITLREGTSCGPANNELQIVNVKDIHSPIFIKSYPMTSPQGLSKDNNELFVCDGKDGLKIYDVSNASNIILKKHIKGLEPYDVIAWNNNLFVVAKDGLYQYDYSNPYDLILESKLSINSEN